MNILFVYLKMQQFSCFEYFFLSVLRIFCSRRFKSKTHMHTYYITGILHMIDIVDPPNTVKQWEAKHDHICTIRTALTITCVFVFCSVLLLSSADVQP